MNLYDIEAIKQAEFDAWFATFHLRQMCPRIVGWAIWQAAMERAGSRPMATMDTTAQQALAIIEQRQHEKRLRELADAAPEVNRRKGEL